MKKIRIRCFNINLGPYSAEGQDVNINYHPSVFDRVLEAVSALMVIAGCIYLVANDGFENKDMLIGFLVNFLVCLLMFTSAYAPVQYIRFPVRISGRNIVKQYVMALRLMRIVNMSDARFQCIVHQFPLGKSSYRNSCNGNAAFNNGLLYFCHQKQIIKT